MPRYITVDGVQWIDPRNTRAWRDLRDRVIAAEPTCRLRFPGICTTASTTADHIIPVSVRPDLALVRTNLRGTCRPCNEARRTVPDEALRLDQRAVALDIFG